jgi:membrane fusion protein (multidrug efflux system)
MSITRRLPLRMPALLRGLAVLAVAGGLGFAGFRHWQESRRWMETDNAYLDAPVHPIAARLIGTVAQVLVEENSQVRQGQVLLTLDPRDAQVGRDQNEAKLVETQATLAAAEAGVVQARANAKLNDIALERFRLDLVRMQGLVGGGRAAVARQDLDHAQAAFDSAGASVVLSKSSIEAATAEIGVAKAKQASAAVALRESELQCEYTILRSPVDGRVGRRNVETGQPVIPAQPLIALVGNDLWLTANFKETQISAIRPGQAARIRFDAFPDREWPGTVESVSPASGSRFALLPPDNATGNFTRVVQRLPIRIRLDESTRREIGSRLAPGLSAKVRVRVVGGPKPEVAPAVPGGLTRR